MGRPPKYCLDHRRNQKRDRARAARRKSRPEPEHELEPVWTSEVDKDRRSGREAAKRDGARRAELAARAGRARLLALGLALDVDPVHAAATVGIEATGEELAELAAVARTRHADLCKLDTAAIGRILLAAIGQCAVRLLETVSTIAPSQLPGAIRQAVQALELLQGDAEPVMSELRMVFKVGDAEEGKEWDLNQLLPEPLQTSASSKSSPAPN